MRYTGLFGFLFIQGCVSAPAQWTPADRLSAVTCSAPDTARTSSWQLVPGEGFTFCVPAQWRSSDGRTWRSGGGFLGWCTPDHLDKCPNVTGELTMQVITNRNQVLLAMMANEGGACSTDRFQASTGGAFVSLLDQHCNGRHVTEAIWTRPALYFFGQTDDPVMARLQLDVYRTVRFTGAQAH
jgi:hypothetical protein